MVVVFTYPKSPVAVNFLKLLMTIVAAVTLTFTVACKKRKETYIQYGYVVRDSLLTPFNGFRDTTGSYKPQPAKYPIQPIYDSSCDSVILFLQKALGAIPDCNRAERLMLLADFTYAYLPFEVFPGLWAPKREWDEENWLSLTWQQQCAIAKGLQYGFACGYRTDFFTKLIPAFGYSQYFIVSVPGKHTYPIVNVGTDEKPFWIIADPYDPFVVTDSSGAMLDVFQLLHVKEGTILRTKRNFGPSLAMLQTVVCADNGNSESCMAELLRGLNTELLEHSGHPLGHYYNTCWDTLYTLPVGSPFAYAFKEYGRADTFSLQHLFAQGSMYFSNKLILKETLTLSNAVVDRAAKQFLRTNLK